MKFMFEICIITLTSQIKTYNYERTQKINDSFRHPILLQ